MIMKKEKKFLIPEAEICIFPNIDILTTSEVGDDDDEDLPEYP